MEVHWDVCDATACRIQFRSPLAFREVVHTDFSTANSLLDKQPLFFPSTSCPNPAVQQVSIESMKEWKNVRQGLGNHALINFISNVRNCVPTLKLPPQPLSARRWMLGRGRDAVRFVSALLPPQTHPYL